MDDELSKPYKKLAAVEEQIESNSLLDLYIDLYKRKYKTEPIFPVTRVHMTQIKDLQRLTKGQARVFISEYFQINDEWIKKQHHDLPTLLKSLNKLSAIIAKRDGQKDLRGKLTIQFHCDACQREFTLLWPMNSTYCDKLVRCHECERQNKPTQKINMKTKLVCKLPEVPQ